MKQPDIELRMLPGTVELREGDGDGSGTIVGYAAVFGVSTDLGWFTEEVKRGAFKESIGDDDIRALVDHESPRILGRNTAGTLRLKEDKRGLKMEIDVPKTTVGADIVESIKRGDVSGASFGFRTMDDKWETRNGKEHRTLIRAKLFDVGPVSFPAYPTTEVGVRAVVECRKQELSAATDAAEEVSVRAQLAARRQRQAEAQNIR